VKSKEKRQNNEKNRSKRRGNDDKYELKNAKKCKTKPIFCRLLRIIGVFSWLI